MKKLIALTLIIACWQLAALPAHAATKPNIIVFIADDMGYADAGFTGSTDIKTPNLDALAAGGMVCTSGYVTHPYCGPSRAGLLSGRCPRKVGHGYNMVKKSRWD